MGAPTLIEFSAVIGLGLSAVPAVLTAVNLPKFRRAPREPAVTQPISVLIPARDEAASIERTCKAILASEGVELELTEEYCPKSDSEGISVVTKFGRELSPIRF